MRLQLLRQMCLRASRWICTGFLSAAEQFLRDLWQQEVRGVCQEYRGQ